MDFELISLPVQSRFGVTLPNTLTLCGGPPKKLMVMLPGRNYSCDRPALYFVRRMALNNGFDVLSLHYGFQVTQQELAAEQFPFLQEDAADSVKSALERGYQEVCLVGKSMGTPLAVELAKGMSAEKRSLILLTPVMGAAAEVGEIKTLAVIGTADPYYTSEQAAYSSSTPYLQWRVFADLDHGLEVKSDWKVSMMLLQEIVNSCQSFLKSVHS